MSFLFIEHRIVSWAPIHAPDFFIVLGPGAKTIKKNTNSTQNKSQTSHAKQYGVTSFLSTDCELSTETCSKNVYSLGPRSQCSKHQHQCLLSKLLTEIIAAAYLIIHDIVRELRDFWFKFFQKHQIWLICPLWHTVSIFAGRQDERPLAGRHFE